ncbi:hypothetical protein CR513_20812, partial [Mucuna pruriens]
MHNDFSRHRSLDDVSSSKDVQFDFEKSKSSSKDVQLGFEKSQSSQNGSASKRLGISSTKPNSYVEPSAIETFLRNNSGQGMHNDFSRHRSLDDVSSSKDVILFHNLLIYKLRIQLQVEDLMRRFVPQAVTRDIISIVIMRMPTPIEKWKKYPISVKDDLFRDFMDKYKFRSDFDRNMTRTVMDHLELSQKYGMVWLTPEWEKKSNANQSNRALDVKLKHPISYIDVYDHVYDHVHKNKDGEYVSQHSKNFTESYDTVMLEKYEENSSMQPLVDYEVWIQVLGSKKRRVFETLSLEVIGPSHTSAPIEEVIKEVVNVTMTSFVEKHLMPMLEPIISLLSGSHAKDCILESY